MSKLAYKPGDVIQRDCKPFVKILRRDWKGLRCDNCFQFSSALARCAGCKAMHYCNSSCQRHDWKNGHKIECSSKVFQEFMMDADTDPMLIRVFRLLAHMKMKPHLADVKHSVTFHEEEVSLNDLRRSMTSEDKERELESFPWVEILDRIISLDNLEFVIDDLLEGSYLFTKHSYILYDCLETEVVGHGLYVETYFLGHSCSPNALPVSVDGTKLRIRAIDNIPPGEPFTICYSEMFSTKKDRQEFLMRTYKFVCQCRRCESEKEEIDYEKLKRLIGHFTDSINSGAGYRFSYFLALHNEVLNLLTQLYPEFHDTITSQYLRLFSVLKMYRADISNKRLAHLVGKIREHVAITFGEDHTLYQLFMSEVSVLKIKL